MCNTGLLKADITPRPNNPPLRNEALHVHVHLPPPERVPLVVLSCVPGPWRTLIPTSSCLFGTLNYFLLSFVWPGIEPATFLAPPHGGPWPRIEPAPFFFMFFIFDAQWPGSNLRPSRRPPHGRSWPGIEPLTFSVLHHLRDSNPGPRLLSRNIVPWRRLYVFTSWTNTAIRRNRTLGFDNRSAALRRERSFVGEPQA